MTPPPTIRHLYVHVPFCPSICPYCDFHVLTRSAGAVEAYLKRLREEVRELADRYDVDLDTVYLGGGTPSFLRDAELADLVSGVREHLGWGRLENTLEVNPGTVSPARAATWQSLGFDRASVGVQSLDDPTLKFLGRQHDADGARAALSMLGERGFRVSGDLITAVPGQPLERDVRDLVACGVEHVSAYTLTIEPGTEFARRGVVVAEEDERLGFERTAELLAAHGFERYEVSNYARPGAESRHNLAYWHNRFYLGVGPSAAGHYPSETPGLLGERHVSASLWEWLRHEPGSTEPIDAEEHVTDALFMGLRLKRGVDLPRLASVTGVDLETRYADVLARLRRRGLVEHDREHLTVTDAGRWVLNEVIREFLNA